MKNRFYYQTLIHFNFCKLTVFLLLLFHIYSSAQQIDRSSPILNQEFPRSYKPIIFETIKFFDLDTVNIKVYVPYRIDPAFFFFIRKDDPSQELYIAKGEIVIEILNDNGVTIKREIESIYIEKNYSPPSNEQSTYELEGLFTINIPQGIYNIIIEVKDFASNRIYVDKENRIKILTQDNSSIKVSDIIFVKNILNDNKPDATNSYFLINYGGNSIIGQKGLCLLEIINDESNNNMQIQWSIRNTIFSDGLDEQKYEGNGFSKMIGVLNIKKIDKNISVIVENGTSTGKVIYIPIPLEKLTIGKYELTINLNSDSIKRTISKSFQIIWPNEPFSLRNLNLAIDALQYIATEKEMKEIRSSSLEKSKRAFNAFWKKRNPDTLSAYNPVMAEYYRRVDEALKRFSVKDEPNGYRTDRGRIFILFGSPTTINRILKPDMPPKEIWTYEKLKRRFTFIDNQRNSNYILMKEEKY